MGPLAYTGHTWTNGAGEPVNANNLSEMDSAIVEAQRMAAGTRDPLSTFAGADDDAKITAWATYRGAQTFKGVPLWLDEIRRYDINSLHPLFTGHAILGQALPQDQNRSGQPLGQS